MAVSMEGFNLRYVSPTLKENSAILLEAMKHKKEGILGHAGLEVRARVAKQQITFNCDTETAIRSLLTCILIQLQVFATADAHRYQVIGTTLAGNSTSIEVEKTFLVYDFWMQFADAVSTPASYLYFVLPCGKPLLPSRMQTCESVFVPQDTEK